MHLDAARPARSTTLWLPILFSWHLVSPPLLRVLWTRNPNLMRFSLRYRLQRLFSVSIITIEFFYVTFGWLQVQLSLWQPWWVNVDLDSNKLWFACLQAAVVPETSGALFWFSISSLLSYSLLSCSLEVLRDTCTTSHVFYHSSILGGYLMSADPSSTLSKLWDKLPNDVRVLYQSLRFLFVWNLQLNSLMLENLLVL